MKLGEPLWLAVLPAILLPMALLWWASSRRTRESLRKVFNTPLLPRLLRSVDPIRRRVKKGLLVLGLAGLTLALARPQWGRSEVEVERTGGDLVIALDVSTSMLATDVAGTNRLTAAARAIRGLLGEMGGDRAALVVFAGEAFLAAPLTRDHMAVERALAAAGPEAVTAAGSNLGEAIKRSREVFDRAARGPRCLLVISDGEQLQGDAVESARAAARDGIQVHTAGVGSIVGARIPNPAAGSGTVLRNALGREVISRRDEQRLRQLAHAGGGLYTRLEDDPVSSLVEWYRRVQATLPRTTERRHLNEPAERYQWPLALGMVALAVELILNDRRRPRTFSEVKP
ncbi:MAG: VWA domain-containing protein [Limisphaerales bacterium]